MKVIDSGFVVTYRGEDVTSSVDLVVEKDDGVMEVCFQSGDVMMCPPGMSVAYWAGGDVSGDVLVVA